MPGVWRNYLHSHSFIEVCYAFSGQGVFHIQDQNQRVDAGTLFVARPREAHEIVSAEGEELGIAFWAYALDRLPGHHPDMLDVDSLLDAFLASRRPIQHGAPAVSRTLELLNDEMDRRDPAYGQAVEALVVKLLIESSRAVTDLTGAPGPSGLSARSTTDLVVRTILQYLHDNYGRPISARDVAAQVHLSERHAGRLFHRVMGVSLLEYLTSLRLDIAAQLLLRGDRSIKDVAVHCGYPDVQYFTNLFRRHQGLTPGRYRAWSGRGVPSETPPADPSA